METLKELNFNKLIKLDVPDVNRYNFSAYVENQKHHPIIEFCTSCEQKHLHRCWDIDENGNKKNGHKDCSACAESHFALCNISHGAHTDDFLEAANQTYDTSSWNKTGVMFIMESPSNDYGIYEKHSLGDTVKRPTKLWYWIHDKLNITGYPDQFKGGIYGEFVASAIVTFKLANAYMTNLIKCGLNNADGTDYRGIGCYNPDCKTNCFNEFLRKELDIVNPKVIFTFGTRVYELLKEQMNSTPFSNIPVIGLPHPAGQRRGFKDEYYNVLYFCMIAKGLYKAGSISEDFYHESMEIFAQQD